MEDKKGLPSIWLVLALVLTVAYSIFIWFAVDVTLNTAENSRNCIQEGWMSAAFGCLTMNEFGDFFAGAFAPLAFIWLAAAVLIQSQELKAQRKELTLTRESVDQNREVMAAQADETRRQADYIEQQTNILKSEQVTREDAEQVRIFNANIKRLAARMRGNYKFYTFYEKGHQDDNCIDINVYDRNEINDEKTIQTYSNCINTLEYKQLKSAYKNSNILARNPEGFKEVFEACNLTLQSYKKIPEESQVQADTLRLISLMREFNWLADVAENLDLLDLADNSMMEITFSLSSNR